MLFYYFYSILVYWIRRELKLIFPTKKPQILIYNIIFDLIVGIFFVYYLKVSANLSTFLRVILMAFAAYDFTDMFFSIKLLFEQRRRNKHKWCILKTDLFLSIIMSLGRDFFAN